MKYSVRFHPYGALIGSNGLVLRVCIRTLFRGSRNRANNQSNRNQPKPPKMERICQLGQFNSKLQLEIDSLNALIANIKEVNTVNINWADSVVLDCIAKHLTEEVELKVWEKDLNKQEMTNLLVQALPQ